MACIIFMGKLSHPDNCMEGKELYKVDPNQFGEQAVLELGVEKLNDHLKGWNAKQVHVLAIINGLKVFKSLFFYE